MRVRGTPTPHGPTSRYSEPENGAEIPKPGPKPGPTGSAGTDPVPLSRAPRTTAPGSPRRGGQRPAGGGPGACVSLPGRAGPCRGDAEAGGGRVLPGGREWVRGAGCWGGSAWGFRGGVGAVDGR